MATVPPRPQRSYTVRQRETLVEGLVHDREHARYTDQVVRYRAGVSDEPPPPAPPPPPVARPAPALPPPPAAADDDPALTLEEPPSDSDDGSLDDFIRDLVRETEGRRTPAPPVAPAGELTGEPRAMAEPPPAASGSAVELVALAPAAEAPPSRAPGA
ncbi:MAG TPA: hypothetical protein VFG47_18935, partial [Geminicoccaceae bacterium]|nr:hypothetical protein [Geminicoccaceae bacterium]